MSLGFGGGGSGGGGVAENTAVTFKSLVLASPDANTAFLSGTGYSLTSGNGSFIDLAGTWNNAGSTPTAIKLNVTDTASNAASLLMDLQVGGVSKANADKNGNAVFGLVALRSPNASYFNRAIVRSTSDSLTLQSDARIQFTGVSDSFSTSLVSFCIDPTGRTIELASDAVIAFSFNSEAANVKDLILRRAAAATLQLGITHSTTPTTQTIKAHDVATGTGADLILSGGAGSVANGDVILNGANRAAYDASPSTTTIRDILISHGLMAAS